MNNETTVTYDKERIESLRKEKIEMNSRRSGVPVDFLDHFNVKVSADSYGEKLVKKIISSLKRQIKKLVDSCTNISDLKRLVTKLQGNGSSTISIESLSHSGETPEEKEYIARLMKAVADVTPSNKEASTDLDKVSGYVPLSITVDRQTINDSPRQKETAYAFGKLEFKSSKHNQRYALRTKGSQYYRMMNLSSLLAEIYFMNALESFVQKNEDIYEYAFCQMYVQKLLIPAGEKGKIKDTLQLPEDQEWATRLQRMLEKFNFLSFDEINVVQANILKLEDHFPLKQTEMSTLAIHLLAREFIETADHIRFKVDNEMSIHSEYARAFETKKAINKNTLAAMSNNAFLEKYSYVELDNDVHLSDFRKLEKEFSLLCQRIYIPKSNYSFRIKKLGKHRASGLHVSSPVNATIVDLQGISSYIHELGHQLDYSLQPNQEMISEGIMFKHIIHAYRTELMNKLDRLAEDHPMKVKLKGKSKYNLSYYLQPTEIFARSYEIYVNSKGIRSSLLKAEAAYEDQDNYVYPSSEGFKKKVVTFFDCLFKDYKPDQALEGENSTEPFACATPGTNTPKKNTPVDNQQQRMASLVEKQDGQLSFF